MRLRCLTTGEVYDSREPLWRSVSGGLLDLEFVPRFDPEMVQGREPTLWRYREVLPIQDARNFVSLGEPMTPLVPVEIGGRVVFVKQDHLFPTGSYKDRGAAVLVSKIRELGIRHVIEDSSGNAGSAVAAYCARAGVACEILVPEDTSPAKTTQIQSYGAKLVRVPGSREETAQAALARAEQVYYASHSWNPYFFQGTKTFAYEVCEQLGWRSPDSLVLPVGNGTLLLGASIGFEELRQAGIVDSVPRLIGVQSTQCAPLYHAHRAHLPRLPVITKRPTIAEGIAIAEPVRGMQILDAVIRSGGDILAVDEEAVLTALSDMIRQGFYIEPTSAATIAGVSAYLATAAPSEIVVTLFSGHGLKAGSALASLPLRG
jgi:threonine synthase